MYIPPHYKNQNIGEVYDFIEKNGLGILISTVDDKPWATHIPMLLSANPNGHDTLTGHVSKANPQWQQLNGQQVLAIFNGPHTYISSSWYAHENVPTWNYIAVHCYGTIRLIDGEELLSSLKHLVHKYEKASEHPVSVDKMSPKLLEKEIHGIVGFEITVSDIQPADKLSQNRNKADHGNIITELEKRKDGQSDAIAREMKKHTK